MNQEVFATGWGHTEHNGKASEVLMEVQLKIQSWQNCKYFFGRSLTENMICAYAKDKDTCQGDSGGTF